MKVGDYVRTKDYLDIQLICKVEKIIDEYCIDTDKGYWDKEHIIKSSPNIIDLIEIGDYVNGRKIEDKYKDRNGNLIVREDCGDSYYDSIFENKNIKSVVTKEQFENMEYKI